MTVLSAASGCLTKMEIVLIFVLSITAGYAVKMEMLIADVKELSSPTALIEKSGVERDSANVKQSKMIFETGYTELAHNDTQSFIARSEVAD
mgnify:CR=1 FL=1